MVMVIEQSHSVHRILDGSMNVLLDDNLVCSIPLEQGLDVSLKRGDAGY